ncbi:MAG: VWA domain-containing protein [Planctomycetes bacterium]|nr:VWA domain-containing protein [Planctomycetota bacterium]
MKHQLIVLALALLGLGCNVGAQVKKPEDPVLVEFRQYIGDADALVRAEQVERLGRSQTADSVNLLINRGLLDGDSRVRDRAVRTVGKYESAEARGALLAALQHNKPEIRAGVVLGLSGQKSWSDFPHGKLIAMLALDRDADVRSACAETLSQLGHKEAIPALGKALSDKNGDVAIAAADALSVMAAGAEVVPALAPLLDSPNWRLQVAAVNALGRGRTKESVPFLIDYLGKSEGRPQFECKRVLTATTDQEFELDAVKWKEWWDRVNATWTAPPPKNAKAEATKAAKDGYGRKVPEYHSIPTPSKNILFVIDVSSSMETPILLKAGKNRAGSDVHSGGTPKLAVAREELAACLRSLDDNTKINIIAFESDVRVWQPEPVTASPGNVQLAIRWIQGQKSRKAGQLASDGTMTGRTNTYAALRVAYGLVSKRPVVLGATTAGGHNSGPKPGWDTCFFLSDGAPTEGQITDIPTILEEVEKWNKSAKMVVNAIGMEEEQGLAILMTGLARVTGGKCVFVGK